MAISASMVKELREMTGAGMMDCEKKAGRIAAEGIVKTNISEDGKQAAIVEVNSETDFVAKNEKFQDFVGAVASQVNASGAADIDAFMDEAWAADTSKTVKEELASMIATIGENMNIRRFEKVSCENGLVVDYIHAGGKIGVLIAAETDNTGAEVTECLKNIAMQIAAMNPKYLSSADVSEEYKEKEKEVLLAQAKNDPANAGKPDNIIEKMIIGRLNKELKEVCLTEQVYVKAENKESVAKYVESVAKAAGCSIKLTKFVRFETGEGLEKKNEDFAAEVAAQLK